MTDQMRYLCRVSFLALVFGAWLIGLEYGYRVGIGVFMLAWGLREINE